MKTTINKAIKNGKCVWAIVLGLLLGSSQGSAISGPHGEKNAAQPLIKITKAPEHFQSRKISN